MWEMRLLYMMAVAVLAAEGIWEVKILYIMALVVLAAATVGRAQNVTCSATASPTITAAQNRAQIDLANHDYKAVERDLSPLVAAHPEACQLALLLGKGYLYDKDDRKAAAQFRNVLARDPHDPIAKLEMARLYGYHDQYKQSNLLYKELLSADPGNEQASIGLARNLIREQRLSDAKEIVYTGLAAHPNSLRLQAYRDALARPGTAENGVSAVPPRPADVQTRVYLVTDSAGDRVTENLSRLNFSLSKLLSAQLATNFRYLSSVGTVVAAPGGNTENVGGDGSISSMTFDGSAILKYHVKPWMTFTAGGGGISYNDGVSRALFQGGIDFHPARALYIDTAYIRTPILPTQQAATFDLAAQGLRSNLDWYPSQWRIHVDASELKYTDGNLRHSQNAEAIRWFGSGAVRFGAGYSGSHFTFSHILSHGYFSPDTYQNHSGSGAAQLRYHHSFTGEYKVDFGGESISGLAFRPTYAFSAHNTIRLSALELYVDYTRFHFTQATGAFRTDVVAFGVKHRF
jgi:thioredoxin-like negative regulator of GroEL